MIELPYGSKQIIKQTLGKVEHQIILPDGQILSAICDTSQECLEALTWIWIQKYGC